MGSPEGNSRIQIGKLYAFHASNMEIMQWKLTGVLESGVHVKVVSVRTDREIATVSIVDDHRTWAVKTLWLHPIGSSPKPQVGKRYILRATHQKIRAWGIHSGSMEPNDVVEVVSTANDMVHIRAVNRPGGNKEVWSIGQGFLEGPINEPAPKQPEMTTTPVVQVGRKYKTADGRTFQIVKDDGEPRFNFYGTQVDGTEDGWWSEDGTNVETEDEHWYLVKEVGPVTDSFISGRSYPTRDGRVVTITDIVEGSRYPLIGYYGKQKWNTDRWMVTGAWKEDRENERDIVIEGGRKVLVADTITFQMHPMTPPFSDWALKNPIDSKVLAEAMKTLKSYYDDIPF